MTILHFRDNYRFLSNFYDSPIEYEGILYPTVEHAYQALKSTDLKTREWMAKLGTPALAKGFGRTITLRPDWEEVKLNIMEKLLRLKFEIPELRKQLKETWPHSLIEGNHWGDSYWGLDLKTNKGFNHLGVLLMKIRGELL